MNKDIPIDSKNYDYENICWINFNCQKRAKMKYSRKIKHTSGQIMQCNKKSNLDLLIGISGTILRFKI